MRRTAWVAAALLSACAAESGDCDNLLSPDAPPWSTGWSGSLNPQWQLDGGVLTLVKEGGGDISQKVIYGPEFDLRFEYRVSPGGNSGVFYFVSPRLDRPAYHSGPEFQILDNERHADGGSALTSAGAVYGLYPTDPDASRPAGEWNRGRIRTIGGQVEHWLNGVKTASYDIESADFKDRVSNSKFSAWRDTFAREPRGAIVLQDHGDRVSFRNLCMATPRSE